MTKKKVNRQTEKAMYMTIISTALCVVMLVGMTFAWFTSTVESSQNVIKTANFDVDVLWSDDISTIYPTSASALENGWHDLDAGSTIANNNSQPFNELSFLPGQEVVRYIALYNKSSFNVKFDVSLRAITDNTTASDALLDALEIYTVVPVTANNPVTSAAMTKQGTAAELQKPGDALTQVSSSVVAGITEANTEKVTVMAISVKLPESYSNPVSETVNFYIKVIASQWNVEHEDATAPVVAGQPTVLETPKAKATVPAGAVDADSLTLTVVPGDADANLVAVIDDGNSTTTYDVNLTNQNGVKVISDVGIKVELDIGIVDLQDFYHNTTKLTKVNSADEVDEENEYYYNVTTGKVTFITKSFSPFTSEYLFAGGIGTEEYPYLIENYEQLQSISSLWYDYNYYKVKDGVTTIDCINCKEKGYVSEYMNGVFDGNNCKFINLDGNLFKYVTGFIYNDNYSEISEYKLAEIKNLEAYINVSGTSNNGLIYYIYMADSATLTNVKVHGYVEGYMASPYIGFYQGLNSSSHKDYLTFNNCYSDATLVSKNERACGFVCNFYYAYGEIRINNSEYDGVQYTVSGNFSYIHGMNNSNIYLVFDEAAATIAANHTTMNIVANTKYTSNDGANPKYDKDNTKTIKFITSNVAYELGDKIIVAAAENASYATFTLQIGGNTINNGGNFVGPYMTEIIDTTINGNFVSNNIEYCHCVVNPQGCDNENSHLDAETHYYHVHNTYYDANTCNSAFITVAQYNSNDQVVGVTTIALPKN